jgi:hypothetical protein
MLRSFAAVCLAALVSMPIAAQSNMAAPEKFTAFAVDTSTLTTRARTTSVDITINRWSSDADRDRLLGILRDHGQDALLAALQKMPVVGYLTTPGSLRYDLHFAREIAQPDGGRRIVLGTDRYVGSWEARNRPRTIDYPFTVIELQVDRHGEGVGKASIYTKITAAKNGNIELENFANQPVMLNEVRRVKS